MPYDTRDPELPPTSVSDWVTEWVLGYVREPNLWPVAVAILGHVVLAVAGVALVGWRTGSGLAWLVLAGLGALTAWLAALEVQRYGRPGPTWVALAATWVASGVVTWFAQRTGLL